MDNSGPIEESVGTPRIMVSPPLAANWRENALWSLSEARAEVEAATEPVVVAIAVIGEQDLLKERPVSLYANQSRTWLNRFFSFIAWRTSLWPEAEKAEQSVTEAAATAEQAKER